MFCLFPGLHVGSVDAALNVEKLKRKNIHYILTIDIKPLPDDVTKLFESKLVEAEDVESFDILSRLEECLEFIDEGIRKGGILVHWYVKKKKGIINRLIYEAYIASHAGVSRSVCVVTAYIMKKNQSTLIETEEQIRKIKPDIQINNGFINQLLLFEGMKWKIDENHPLFKKHKFKMLQQKIQREIYSKCCAGSIGIRGFSPEDPQPLMNSFNLNYNITEGHHNLDSSVMAKNPKKGGNLNDDLYKCKKCRKPLFCHSNVYPHEIDETKAFQPRANEINATQKCSSLFLEPMEWMEKLILSNLTGKLECPHCSFKLGRFNWSGARCSCGVWVTPALQIHDSNVDRI